MPNSLQVALAMASGRKPKRVILRLRVVELDRYSYYNECINAIKAYLNFVGYSPDEIDKHRHHAHIETFWGQELGQKYFNIILDMDKILIDAPDFNTLPHEIYRVYRNEQQGVFVQADLAILITALHTALYIFNPSGLVNQGGLYPHRRFAYLVWFIVPVIMASLAFLNPEGGYTSQGTFCQMPVRPFWYRLGLSWVPRYLILTIMLGLYVAIYIYVRAKFRAIEDDLSHPSLWREIVTGHRDNNDREKMVAEKYSPRKVKKRGDTHQLRRHGLISTGSDSSSNSVNWTPQRITFDRTMTALTMMSLEVGRQDRELRDGPDFSNLEPPSRRDPIRLESFSQEERPAVRGSNMTMADVLNESRLSDRETVERRNTSRSDLEGAGLDNMSPTDQLRMAHRNIRRQLRLLFVYPLVYFLMWMIPFANHCLQYGDQYSKHPSFVLSTLLIIDLALQCAVNCVLFSTREKPWRYIPSTDGTLLSSFKFRRRTQSISSRNDHDISPRKRKSQPVSAQARDAHGRRELERADAIKLRDMPKNSSGAADKNNHHCW
ncbi:MAG: hypothetical protein M1816_005640 [Peltula sp. TS41687]|nr:MAG: hypothetical protein M1816_005640 [Peltula sp. TS41687]